MYPLNDWPLDPSIFIYKDIYIELNSWNFFIKNNRPWVSEWLLFNADSAILQLYHGENT
jgi:hypothetical protein